MNLSDVGPDAFRQRLARVETDNIYIYIYIGMGVNLKCLPPTTCARETVLCDTKILACPANVQSEPSFNA